MKKLLYQLLYCIGVIACIITEISCKKFLDEKPDKSKTTIEKLSDLQEILDNNSNSDGGALIAFGTDEYYIPDKSLAARRKEERDAYTWDSKTDFLTDWVKSYAYINLANTVLKELDRFSGSDRNQINFIKGQALMQRAFWFHQLAEIYAPAYSEQNKMAPSIPLRTTPDLEAPIQRSTVEETYNKITGDLKEAADLLPVSIEAKNRGNRANCFGLLARVFLSMRDYSSAEIYSKKYLELHSTLMEYSTLDSTKNPTIPFANVETSFWIRIAGPFRTDQVIDSSLYAMYSSDDLRRPIFFVKNSNGTIGFKGSYGGEAGYIPFNGITSSEIMLIHSECLVRAGKNKEGLDVLNSLLEKRWKKGKFISIMPQNPAQDLQTVLNERRKELIFRSTRWSDLRRLNLEGANISLKRVVEGTSYTLSPNDNRWVWLIPSEIMALNNWTQNKR